MRDVRIKYFESVAEADLAKNLLESHGIKSVIQKKSLRIPSSTLGVGLFVLEKDAERAKEILESRAE